MEMLDVSILARFQFAFTVAYHFLFVPMSIGLGLIMALAQMRDYKNHTPENEAAAQLWVKIFAATFVVGVATGITMEFAFGTNWADYSRFVGDIFGAPLAAEALLAFFLESSFLGVLLFARKKISPRLYTISAWLVWLGSCLSALWILIANSWMQTPAGYEVAADGSKAVITDFWAAAFNPSTGARYFHTVDSVLIAGAFMAVAIGAYHLLKGNKEFGRTTVRTGAIVAAVTLVLMIPAGHQQAVVVAQNQPEKLAAMEAQYETGPVGMAIAGWVDEEGQTVIGITIPIEGLTSFLATGDTSAEYPGLNDFAEGDTPPVQIVFQAYHLMVALFGVMIVMLALALLAVFRRGREPRLWMLKLLMWSPLFPMLAIQSGWIVAEVGRQPWIVWHELRTADAISQAVSATDTLITLSIFVLLYAFILVMYLRVVLKFIKAGPVLDGGSGGPGGSKGGFGFSKGSSPRKGKNAVAADGGEAGAMFAEAPVGDDAKPRHMTAGKADGAGASAQAKEAK